MGKTADNVLLDHALRYAVLGWPVMPIHTPITSKLGLTCSCSKNDCYPVGKHPRVMRGLKDASTEKHKLVEWWTNWPQANIGIITGLNMTGKRLVIVDVDTKKNGMDNWSRLIKDNGRLPETPEAITGSGGRHIFFYSNIPIRNTVNHVADGIDIRGDGGYIVAPPSLHKSGKRYKWIVDPFTTPLANVPEWLLVMMIQRKLGSPPTTTSSTKPVTFNETTEDDDEFCEPSGWEFDGDEFHEDESGQDRF